MEKTIYQQAIEKFGVDSRVDLLLEEMSELQQALLKYRRKPDSMVLHNIHEEFADVQIVMSQIILLLNEGDIDKWREKKLNRLQTLING